MGAWIAIGIVIIIIILKVLILLDTNYPNFWPDLGLLIVVTVVVGGTITFAIRWPQRPAAIEKRRQKELAALHAKASEQPFPQWETFLRAFTPAFDWALKTNNIPAVPEHLRVTMLGVATDIYEHELLALPPPPPDTPSFDPNLPQSYKHRIGKVSDPEATLKSLVGVLVDCMITYLKGVPSLTAGRQPFLLPLYRLLPNPQELMNTLIWLFTGLPTPLFQQFRANYGRPPAADAPPELFPVTPLTPLFSVGIPYGLLPDEERFQHSWIVAPTGTGKTTLLENLIMCDLERVAKNEASIFIMDSQNELIPRLTALKEFHEGPLKGKLIVLEPSAEFPLALNLFDNQLDDIDHLSGEDKENLLRFQFGDG